MDQNFFVTPFASLGDKTSFPIPTDPGGSITFQQGWGPDYQADQTTNPNAKDIDRANTNYLFYIITQAIAALQATGIPEWITSANNNGASFPYAKYAQVRYSATSPGVVFETYVSLVDNNTATPGTDATKWQPIASVVALAADVVAGTSTRLIVTPSSLKAYPGNASQGFDVATALTNTQAVPLLQMLNARGSLNGVSTQNATATLTAGIIGDLIRWTGAAGTLTLPSVASIIATGIGFPSVRFKNDGTGVLTVATGAGDSITVANATVTTITLQPGDDLIIMWPGTANTINSLGGSALRQLNTLLVGTGTASASAAQLSQIGPNSFSVGGPSSGNFTVPAGVFKIKVRAWAAGGGGGGSFGTGSGATGGGGGGYAEGVYAVTPGQVIAYTVGGAGGGGSSSNPPTNGSSGGSTSLGALITASGGGGGNQANGAVQPTPSAGGSASGGSINIGGGGGGLAFAPSTTAILGGQGGPSAFGGQVSAYSSSNGSTGVFPGGGGGGGALGGFGGAAANGFLVIEWGKA